MLYSYPMPPGSLEVMQSYPPYPYPGAMMPGMPMMPPLSSKAAATPASTLQATFADAFLGDLMEEEGPAEDDAPGLA
jgi:hypothetical protein